MPDDEPSLEVRELFGPSVVVLAGQNADANVAKLTPGEARLLTGALPKRTREFATARALARTALTRFGHSNVEILHGPDRCPIWPLGICGSLSHCDKLAIAAIAEGAPALTIGVDAEHRKELDRKLWARVLLPDEIQELELLPNAEMERMALLLFSAKEACYKAQYPRTRRSLGFHDVRVVLEPEAALKPRGSFRCVFRATAASVVEHFSVPGRYRFDALPGGELVTAVWIAAPKATQNTTVDCGVNPH